MPAGYIKIKEKSEHLENRLPEWNLLPFIGRAPLLVVPILDDLIFELFHFHILEPFSVIEEKIKIKSLNSKM